MNAPADAAQPASVDAVVDLLAANDYLCDRRLATAILVAMRINKPLFLEGEAGVGKTEAARALAAGLGARLIRLQCYEGIDLAHAAYEWNYARQLLHIRLVGEREDRVRAEQDVFGPEFLLRRPLLDAIDNHDPVAAGAAHRRDRQVGRGVRGLPARDPRRLCDQHPGAGDDPRRCIHRW